MRFRGLFVLSLLASLSACQSTSEIDNNTASTSPSEESSALPGEGITIRPGTSDWIEERYQAEIINIGLEELGYEVEDIQEVAYPALHVAVANGDLDYTPSHIEKSHANLFDNAGGDETLERVGTLFPIIKGYQISKAIADEYQISSLEQFQDPEIAELFDRDGDGKADLVGCDPGWSCASAIDHQLDAYELQDTVEHVQGQYTVLLADTITRHQQGEPIFYHAYNPHWISTVLNPDQDVIWLEVPFTTYPADRGTITEADTTVDGKNLGLLTDSYRVVASDEFLDANPAAQRWFELVTIPVADMNAVSLRIEDGENTPEDIRRHAEEWVAQNQEQVDQWLEEARQAAL
ncbi:MAG: glycine betaine/L-proline ABC transporter substrate-binding protein ProX [Leptolyngbya sp. SIO1E4]|nr:glycine betaine/L-proline ABC transporter substrate-binding protein ProX [Leptolyngbya sp. SIO1E4]